MAFRQNGDILVTERDTGTLRIIRDGQLLDQPVLGVPDVYTGVQRAGLMDIAVHPDDDSLVYLTYSKAAVLDPSDEAPTWSYEGQSGSTVALARGRLDGGVLTEVRDLFETDRMDLGVSASRVAFGPDGLLYMGIGGAIRTTSTAQYAQDPTTHYGKVLRLRDDGTVPGDNPFVDNTDYLPEIYSMGHRNQIGLGFHPETGELWATENAPQGGDEANIIEPVRRRDAGRPHATYRTSGTDRLQPPGPGDWTRGTACRAQTADSRRPTGAGWVPVRPDR
jgi:glucose/arabinose dehydrogenase